MAEKQWFEEPVVFFSAQNFLELALLFLETHESHKFPAAFHVANFVHGCLLGSSSCPSGPLQIVRRGIRQGGFFQGGKWWEAEKNTLNGGDFEMIITIILYNLYIDTRMGRGEIAINYSSFLKVSRMVLSNPPGTCEVPLPDTSNTLSATETPQFPTS